MERFAERGGESLKGLAPGNVSLAGLLKLGSRCVEMLSVDIWESGCVCAGKTGARD